MKRVLKSILVITLLLFSVQAQAAKPKAYDNVRKIKKTNCGYDDSKEAWQLLRKRKNDLYSLIKKPKKKVRNYPKKLKAYKKNRKLCRKQPSPSAFTLDKLPGAENFLAEITSASAVSGTPPSYNTITDSSALPLYWREVDGANVIAGLNSGSPSANHCSEFYVGDADGESGGKVACDANIDAVRALVKPLEAGIAACYLKNLATEENLAGGGVSLLNGSFPGSYVGNLYQTPSGANSRVVKMQITGDAHEQKIFVRVYSEAENSAANLAYRVDLWFCDGDQTSGAPSGLDQIMIGNDNSYSATSKGLRDGQISLALSGSVVPESVSTGSFAFDTSAQSRAAITFINQNDSGTIVGRNAFDVLVQNGQIDLSKHELNVSSNERFLARFLIEYTGGISDLAMTQGAGTFRRLNGTTVNGSGSAAFEYRDMTYLVTAASSFLTAIQSEDFSGSFFTEDPSFSLDSTGYDCGATSHVEVEVDMSASTMQAVETLCNSFLPQNTAFCESSEVESAGEAQASCPSV